MMTIRPETQTPRSPSWHDELAALLAQPIVVRQGTYREGRMVGVQVSPRPRQESETLDLSVTIFPRWLSPPAADDVAADQVAFTVFLQELRDTAPRVRAAACEALGQLGDAAARAALYAASHDQDRAVRAAATQALVALDTPRVSVSDLPGVRLLLWQRVQHLWKPLTEQVTNQRGQARFANIPTEAVCRLQLRGMQLGGRLQLAAQFVSPLVGQRLAAKSGGTQRVPLPQSQTFLLADGSLLGMLYRNSRGQLMLEFRTDAPQLQRGWMEITANKPEMPTRSLHHFVPLEPDAHGVLTARVLLSEVLDLAQAYEITFEPVPVPMR